MENISIPNHFSHPLKKLAQETISTGMKRINSNISCFYRLIGENGKGNRGVDKNNFQVQLPRNFFIFVKPSFNKGFIESTVLNR
jgi:hypothetical protein